MKKFKDNPRLFWFSVFMDRLLVLCLVFALMVTNAVPNWIQTHHGSSVHLYVYFALVAIGVPWVLGTFLWSASELWRRKR